jgi:hypothetical protein
MPQGLELPNAMLYSAPSKMLDGELNYVSFKPMDRSSFVDSEEFKIRVNSTTDILIPQRSFLKYTLRFTGTATTSATSYLSTLGGASVFKSITTTISGTEVERIDNYNQYCSSIYKRLDTTHKARLAVQELYGASTGINDGANLGKGRTVCHALRIGILESDNYIPLPYCRAGVELSFQLETIARVAKASAPTGYVLENIEFIAAMLTPAAEYLSDFGATLERGGVATIPIQLLKNYKLSPSAITHQEHNLQIGFLGSLNNVLSTTRANATFAQTTDTFANDKANAMSSYYWKSGSQRYPKNFEVKCNNVDTVAPIDPTNQMIALCSLDNTYGAFNSTGTGDTDAYLFYSWQSNSSFGAGLPVSDGAVQFSHTYSTAPATTDVIDFFFCYDAILKISAEKVWVDDRNL